MSMTGSDKVGRHPTSPWPHKWTHVKSTTIFFHIIFLPQLSILNPNNFLSIELKISLHAPKTSSLSAPVQHVNYIQLTYNDIKTDTIVPFQTTMNNGKGRDGGSKTRNTFYQLRAKNKTLHTVRWLWRKPWINNVFIFEGTTAVIRRSNSQRKGRVIMSMAASALVWDPMEPARKVSFTNLLRPTRIFPIKLLKDSSSVAH